MQSRLIRNILSLTLMLGSVITAAPLSAAGFASSAFQVQWQAGEALAPNFGGGGAVGLFGQFEQYREGMNGQRLVQYFDKGRMELNGGAVTNGLLATELMTGRLQKGNAMFESRFP